jgi:membrane protease YdiL (CAAX protease family)
MISDTEAALPAREPLKKQIWGFWPTVGLGVVVGFVFTFVQGIVAMIFTIVFVVENTELDLTELINRLLEDGDLISAATIASGIICTGLILIMIKARHGISIREYLALKPLNAKTVLIVLAVTAGFIGLSFIINTILKSEEGTDIVTSSYSNATSPVFFWIAVVIFAPVFEESFLRGFMFLGFRQSKIGVVGAVILTSLIWAALHLQYNILQMAQIFVLGIILGIVRHKSNSLYSCIIIHALNNLIAIALVSVS